MHELMSLELAKQRREELLREAELRCRAKALRATRKRRDGQRSTLVWEIKRQAGISQASEKNLEKCRLLGRTKEVLLLCAKKELLVGGRTEYCMV